MKTVENRFLLDSATVARNAGLKLRQKGSRAWTLCPFHSERTPSMCFFEDGKWYCFGCHKRGDAVDLYAALYNVSLAEALRVCKGQQPAKRNPSAADLRKHLCEWRDKKRAEQRDISLEARATISNLQAVRTQEQLMADDTFWDAVARESAAADSISLLEAATMKELLKMCNREDE